MGNIVSKIKRLLKEEERIIEEAKTEMERRFDSLALFPGDLAEYERFVGYECEIIDTQRRKKFIRWAGTLGPFYDYDLEFQKRMFEEGVEALIHYSVETDWGSKSYLGVPVKRKGKEKDILQSE